MQVEVKALLDGPLSYKRVLTALESQYITQTLQENHFLDTPGRELFQQGSILRVRLFVANSDAATLQGYSSAAANPATHYGSARLMIKEHSHVEDGSQVSWTAEERIPVDVALAILATPRNIYQLLSQAASSATTTTDVILSRLEREYPREHLEALEHVGSFTTLRSVYRFLQCTEQKDLKIHVDKTTYPFGERFEVEVPDIEVPVHDVVSDVSTFLTSVGATFEFAEESKFQRFVHGTQAARAASHMVQEVKVVLGGEQDLLQVYSALENQGLLSEQRHENFFFDGFDNELASRGAFFRLRRVHDNQFFAVLKEHQDVDEGSQVNWTQEVELSPDVAHLLLSDPSAFLRDCVETHAIANSIVNKFGIRRLRSIGGFSTYRRTYAWPGSNSQPNGKLNIRVDDSNFSRGTKHYEVEVTNVEVPVTDVLQELLSVLQSIGVRCHVAKESKLDSFLRSGLVM